MNKVKLEKLAVFFILSCSLLFGVVFGQIDQTESLIIKSNVPKLTIDDSQQENGSWEIYQNANANRDYGLVFKRKGLGTYFILGHDRNFSTFPNGRLGVGTTYPKFPLHVKGNTKNGNAHFLFEGQNNAYLILKSSNFDSNYQSLGIKNDNGKIYFTRLNDGGGSTKEIITTMDFKTGNVGIGTEVPTEKLEIVGNIKGKKLYVNEICDETGENCKLFSKLFNDRNTKHTYPVSCSNSYSWGNSIPCSDCKTSCNMNCPSNYVIRDVVVKSGTGKSYGSSNSITCFDGPRKSSYYYVSCTAICEEK
jgi:hypothetical protein